MKRERLNPPLCACGCGNPVTKHRDTKQWNKCLKGHRVNIPPVLRAENHPSWKGGRIVSSNGYAYVKKWDHPLSNAQGYVKEERLVMEAHIGRFLDKKEIIHHKNVDKLDNRIENLELFSGNSEHVKHHTKNLSVETRRKLSEANKGRKFPPEFGKAISERMSGAGNHRFGVKASDETRRKMSESQRNRLPCSEETKLKISKAKTGFRFSEESRRKMSESAKHRWGK